MRTREKIFSLRDSFNHRKRRKANHHVIHEPSKMENRYCNPEKVPKNTDTQNSLK